MANPKKQEKNRIYIWSTASYLEAEWTGNRRGNGWLKIGDTCRGVERRKKESITLPEDKITLLDQSAQFSDGKGCFRDHAVHAILERSFNAYNIDGEWYECTVDEVKAAILAAANRQKTAGHATQDFPMRQEQSDAVEKTAAYFVQCQESPAHFLWNAKMRFGIFELVVCMC